MNGVRPRRIAIRRLFLAGMGVVAMAGMPSGAHAQAPQAGGGMSSQSLPPPKVPAANAPQAGGGQAGRAPSAQTGQGQTGQGQSAKGQTAQAQSQSPPSSMPTPPNVWDKRKVAVLAILNKVDGTVSRVSVPVGGELTRDKLHIKVEACLVRPKSMPEDAAAFLDVSGPAADAPSSGSFGVGKAAAQSGEDRLFRGWLLQSEPGAAVVGNAAVTFQIVNCTGSAPGQETGQGR